ncbi:AAA family ATPase [Bosea sp. MMO-172]|uniref:AAA family ATPase n=1 Tax=Bosea sp. MMO-172 TaxID=3127885 RepID=UPI0030158D46
MQPDTSSVPIADRLLASALRLSARGFRVFPLEVDGKTPAHEGWQDAASSHPDRVRAMWSDPFGELVPYNIGVATGNGLTVLDVDVKDGRLGEQSLNDLVTFMDLDVSTFMVRTASGGKHLYYASPDHRIRNSVSAIAEGLDVRSQGGYVVGPGSDIGSNSYLVETDGALKPIPVWLADRCGVAALPSHTQQALVELDEPAAIARAVEWLKNQAPEVVADSGNGDHTGYRIACRVKDFGVSEGEAVLLLLEHHDLNKCHPPQGRDFWEKKVENAYRHGQNAPGVASPAAEFDVIELEQPSATSALADWPSATPLTPFDPVALPRRQWIVRNTFGRRFTSAIIAPGGMGKTQFILQTAIAVAAGRSDIIGRKVIERTPVWYWNQEDDLDELRRRIAAIMQYFRVTWDDLLLEGKPMLYIDSGVERPLTIAIRGAHEDEASATPEIARIKRTIKERGIGLFVVDPLAELHRVKENSNEQMRQVWEILRRIAVECDCATAAGAHTRKPDGASSEGHAGDIHTLRGGGSQAGVVRTAVTMFDMSVKDAKAFGVKAEDRGRYVRLDDAKANLFPKDGKTTWYKRTGVMVGGFDGQEIGVLVPVELEREKLPDDEPEASMAEVMRLKEDPAHHLAEVLAAKFPGGGWHRLSKVVELLDQKMQSAFGPAKNLARKIDAIFCGENSALTEFGILEKISLERSGTKVRLVPSAEAKLAHSLPQNQPEAALNPLKIKDE